jgi:hypothetical protein
MKREHKECEQSGSPELPELPDDAWSQILCQVVQQTEIVIAWHHMTTGWDDDTTRRASAASPKHRPRSQRWQLVTLHKVCKRWPQHLLLPSMKHLQSLEWGAAMWFLNRNYTLYRYKVSSARMSAHPLLTLCPSLTYLDISPQWGEPQLADEVCSTQLHQWTGLRALNLRLDDRYHEPLMTLNFQKLTNIQCLSLRGNDQITVNSILPLIPTLTELDISGALHLFHTYRLTLFTNLRTLTVVENRDINPVALSRMTNLTRLDLRGIPIGFRGRQHIYLSTLTRLTQLTMSSNDLRCDGYGYGADRSQLDAYIESRVMAGTDVTIVDHCRPYPFPRSF